MQMKQWHNFFGKKSQSYSGKDEKEKLIKGEIGCKKTSAYCHEMWIKEKMVFKKEEENWKNEEEKLFLLVIKIIATSEIK